MAIYHSLYIWFSFSFCRVYLVCFDYVYLVSDMVRFFKFNYSVLLKRACLLFRRGLLLLTGAINLFEA